MINLEEELKNFKPELEVEQVETALKNLELSDIKDILSELTISINNLSNGNSNNQYTKNNIKKYQSTNNYDNINNTSNRINKNERNNTSNKNVEKMSEVLDEKKNMKNITKESELGE